MSKQDRISLLRLRFACLAASCTSVQAQPSHDTHFAPACRPSVLSARGLDASVLSPSERARLARETAPYRAFRADVAAQPLRLMPAPFFLPAL